MCNALMELMKDEFNAALNEAVEKEVAKAEKRAEEKTEKQIEQSLLESKLDLIRKKLVKGKSLEVIADELEEEFEVIQNLYEQYLAG